MYHTRNLPAAVRKDMEESLREDYDHRYRAIAPVDEEYALERLVEDVDSGRSLAEHEEWYGRFLDRRAAEERDRCVDHELRLPTVKETLRRYRAHPIAFTLMNAVPPLKAIAGFKGTHGGGRYSAYERLTEEQEAELARLRPFNRAITRAGVLGTVASTATYLVSGDPEVTFYSGMISGPILDTMLPVAESARIRAREWYDAHLAPAFAAAYSGIRERLRHAYDICMRATD